MRILSQDGMVFNDIPYEKFILGIVKDKKTDKFCIAARKESLVSESGFPVTGVMAEYTTEAKAEKAMKMLRDSFEALEVYYQFPKDDMVTVRSL